MQIPPCCSRVNYYVDMMKKSQGSVILWLMVVFVWFGINMVVAGLYIWPGNVAWCFASV